MGVSIPAVFNSYTGGTAQTSAPYKIGYTAGSLYPAEYKTRIKITPSVPCKSITLTFTGITLSSWGNKNFRIGLTESGAETQPSSFLKTAVFYASTQNTSGQSVAVTIPACTLEYEFEAGSDYYLWLHTDYSGAYSKIEHSNGVTVTGAPNGAAHISGEMYSARGDDGAAFARLIPKADSGSGWNVTT